MSEKYTQKDLEEANADWKKADNALLKARADWDMAYDAKNRAYDKIVTIRDALAGKEGK